MAVVRVIDKGWERIKENISIIDDSFTKVGVQKGETHKDEQTGEIVDLVTIAAANEFGTKKIPARPFIRSAFDMNKNRIARVQEKMYEDVLKGNVSVRRGLGTIGEVYQRFITRRIRDIKSPPNAPSTQRAKAAKLKSRRSRKTTFSPVGSIGKSPKRARIQTSRQSSNRRNAPITMINNPLIDTGQLRQSITHVEVL